MQRSKTKSHTLRVKVAKQQVGDVRDRLATLDEATELNLLDESDNYPTFEVQVTAESPQKAKDLLVPALDDLDATVRRGLPSSGHGANWPPKL